MLNALEESGRNVMVSTKSRSELYTLRRKKRFYCPACKEEVLLKIGQKRIPHFSHKKDSLCLFSKGESEQHLQGKEKLFTWLNEQMKRVEIEKYIGAIGQRADIYFPFYGDRAVIEYQCSTISTEEFLLRTNGYHREGIHVLWIYGANQFQRIGKCTFKVSDFLALGTIHIKNGFCLIYYCSKTDCFLVLSSLIPFTSTIIYASITIYQRKNISFQTLFSYPTVNYHSLVKEWMKKKTQYRLYGHKYFYPQWIPFITVLRKFLRPPGCFPSEAGIPLTYGYCIKTPTIVWQTYFLLEYFHSLEIGERFDLKDVIDYFRHKIKEGWIELRHFPLVKEKKLLTYVTKEYLSYLCRIKLIKREGENYEKIEPLSLPVNIEQGLQRDKQFVEIVAKALEEGIQ